MGIASTQYFFDGNKRTAWIAANVFLEANGILLPRALDIEAETFVRAVAANLWSTDEDPDLTISKATEWLRKKAEAKPVDAPLSWDARGSESPMVITGAFFTQYARVSERKLDALGGVWDACWLDEIPSRVALTAVILCQTPGTQDVGLVRVIQGYVVRPGQDPTPILQTHLQIDESENRFVYFPVILDIIEPRRHVFQFMLDGSPDTARTVSLDFRLTTSSAPSSLNQA